ncbi:MAG TPA: hypothetical protein VM580_15875, partial [Labilithrix sp.]|nr:hypothetical protein [Labilithrix sp.]
VASASWNRVGQSTTTSAVPTLTLQATLDASEVDRARDGAVLASAASVIASKRQLEAASAYARGDVARATALTAQNEEALGAALATAPSAAMPALTAQRNAYAEQKKGFSSIRPGSAAGRAVSKSAAAKDLGNLNRASSY